MRGVRADGFVAWHHQHLLKKFPTSSILKTDAKSGFYSKLVLYSFVGVSCSAHSYAAKTPRIGIDEMQVSASYCHCDVVGSFPYSILMAFIS